MDCSLEKVDELLHIGQRVRSIALESAVGGMALSLVGMAVAAAGYLPPVAGVVAREAIDGLAVVNALRVGIRPRTLTDYEGSRPGSSGGPLHGAAMTALGRRPRVG